MAAWNLEHLAMTKEIPSATFTEVVQCDEYVVGRFSNLTLEFPTLRMFAL